MVEDSEADARLLKELLDEEGSAGIELKRVESFWDAKLSLERERYDAMLVDLGLPDSQGMDTMLRLQADAPGIPIVVLTGNKDDALAKKAVRSGAQDYLVKGEFSARSLKRSLSYAVERQELKRHLFVANDRLKRRNDRLTRISNFDALTKVLNRRGFQKVLSIELHRARRGGTPLLAMLIDLDDFKQINAAHGHAMGDLVLKNVGNQLKLALHGTGYAGRIGGDEFMALLPRQSPADGLRLAEILRRSLSTLHLHAPEPGLPQVTASLGLILVPQEHANLHALLEMLHESLARSKGSGKNMVSSNFDL
jgi:diguanylate cyclase (GGDEF)-like protein